MSVKVQRIASDIQKELCSIILEESRNDALKSITITGVEVTTDLSFAKVFYTFYGDFTKEYVQEELVKCASFLRKKLCEKIDVRHIPELIFNFDNSVEYGNKIERLLEKIKENE